MANSFKDHNNYPWKRYWHHREDDPPLDHFQLLRNPESRIGKYFSDNLMTLSKLDDFDCLVLLGEPGIGKTNELKNHYETTNHAGEALFFELRDYDSAQYLVDDIFKNEEFQNWQKDGGNLTLYLDSLDEGLIEIKPIVNVLGKQLRTNYKSGLFLRITCRTATWPSYFESELKNIFKNKDQENSFGVFVLAPLREEDVTIALEKENLNSQKFLRQIKQQEAGPFAAKPVTLKLLIKLFSHQKQLPKSAFDIYKKGCFELAKENNRRRKTAGHSGNLDTSHRIIVAEKIAATTMLTNKSKIFLEETKEDVSPSILPINQITGSREPVNSEISISLDSKVIMESLDTGLFSSRGENILEWSHLTFAEFLASRYLYRRKFSIEQIKTLLFYKDDLTKGVIPQTKNILLWLSMQRRDVQNELISYDPELLIQSEIDSNDSNLKQNLITSIVELSSENRLLDKNWTLYNHYPKLKYPGLKEQLKSILRSTAINTGGKIEAIRIAEACDVNGLDEELITIALDENEKIELRKYAIRSIDHICEIATKAKLLPLADFDSKSDSEQRIKGFSLAALWPDHLDIDSFLDHVTPPKRKKSITPYTAFFSEKFVENLSRDELLKALRWISDNYEEFGDRDNLIDAIFRKGWDYISDSEILEAYCHAALQKIEKHNLELWSKGENEFKEKLNSENQKRKRFVKELIENFGDDIHFFRLIRKKYKYITEEDFAWILSLTKKSNSKKIQNYWTEILWHLFNINIAHQNNLILENSNIDTIKKRFGWALGSIELNSQKSKEEKEKYEERQKYSGSSVEQEVLDPSPKQRVVELLDEFENGSIDAWWKLNLDLQLEKDSKYRPNERKYEITEFPVWQKADKNLKNRLTDAAKEYVLYAKPNKKDWIKDNSFYRPAYAGYRALKLLSKREKSFLKNLDQSFWNKWAPVIIVVETDADFGSDYLFLAKIASQCTNELITEVYQKLIYNFNQEESEIFSHRNIKHLIDTGVLKLLLEYLRNKETSIPKFEKILQLQLRFQNKEAVKYALNLINKRSFEDDSIYEKAVKASALLIEFETIFFKETFFKVLTENSQFPEDVISEIAVSGRREYNFLNDFGEKDLANLYLWLERKYPTGTDPVHEGMYSPSSRDMIADLRRTCKDALVARGTSKAILEIERIIDTLSDRPWLKRYHEYAKRKYLKNSWEPPTPEQLSEMAENNNRSFVRSSADLNQLILSTLNRYQDELQEGQPPKAFQLWNEVKDGKKIKYRPREEKTITKTIQSYLSDELVKKNIVVNSEVEISLRSITDILITAPMPSHNSHSKTIIEVKGCWNKKLESAMEDQLLKKYLKNSDCNQGIYLVVYFDQESWDNRDQSRKNRSSKYNFSDLKKRLKSSTMELNNNHSQTVYTIILDASLNT